MLKLAHKVKRLVALNEKKKRSLAENLTPIFQARLDSVVPEGLRHKFIFNRSAKDREIIVRGLIDKYIRTAEWLSDDISNALRLEVADNVIKSLGNPFHRDIDVLLRAFQYARPPFQKTWIEFSFEGQQCGFFVEDNTHELKILPVMGIEGAQTITFEPEITITPDGISGDRGFNKAEGRLKTLRLRIQSMFEKVSGQQSLSKPDKTIDNTNDLAFTNTTKLALSLLFLLNSKSQVLEVQDVDSSRNNKKYRDLQLKPVVFDLSRLRKKYGKDLSNEELNALGTETLVWGHFKMRKTGLFWWSPHLRNKRDLVSTETAMGMQLERPRLIR